MVKSFILNQQKKKITKLLLKSCSCNNCKFLFQNWLNSRCKNQRKESGNNVCTTWKRLDFTPSMVAEEIVSVQPIQSSLSEIFEIAVKHDFVLTFEDNNGQKNNKITS